MTTDELTSWSAATAACILAFRPVLKWFSEVYVRMREMAASDSVINNLTSLQRINDQLEHIESDNKKVHRVLVFRGHNCGGVPTLENPYHVSLIGKATSLDYDLSVEDYMNIDVDQSYINMLLDVHKNKVIEYNTVSDSKYKQLRQYYVAEGIKHSMIHFIKITKSNDFVYMSISTQDDEGFTDECKAKMRVRVDRIRTLVSEIK